MIKKSDNEKIESGIAAENKIVRGVISLLENLQFKDDDFKQKAKGKSGNLAHSKVIESIRREWGRTMGFGSGAKPDINPVKLGIDFIGREYSDGRILLAVEVDTLQWGRPRSSLLKLCDVRARNKIWILLGTTEKEKANTYFRDVIEDTKNLIRAREENNSSFGNFLIVMKTPKDFQKEAIL